MKDGLDLTEECYHGIGHGTVDQHIPNEWSNPGLVVQNSLELCNKIAHSGENVTDCASGIFNGVANFYTAGQFGLTINSDDPFWLCHLQDVDIKTTCYAFMARVLLTLTQSNLAEAVNSAIKTTPPLYLGTVISNLVVIQPRNNISREELIRLCRSLNQNEAIECLKGFATGLLQSGHPGKEYQEPIDFCNSNLLTTDEQNICLESILPQLRKYYTSDKLKQICDMLDLYNSYRKYCGN